MDCRKAEYLLHGYLDGELDLAATYEFERHVDDCAACAARLAREQALRARFLAADLRMPTPPDLPGKVGAALRRGHPHRVPTVRFSRRIFLWGAAVAAAVIGLVSLAASWGPPTSDSLLAQQVCDAHVRSLMADHLEDVASSDQHTVKPWFAGRLEFSPWVANLTADGFPLQGGRLDQFDNRPVAALVFSRRRHVINLFIWPSPRTESAKPRLDRRNGYQIVHWSAAGMTYWAVSDLNGDELNEFASLVQQRAKPTNEL